MLFFLEILGSARRSLETLPARRTAVPARCTWSVDGPSAQEHPQTPARLRERAPNVQRLLEKSARAAGRADLGARAAHGRSSAGEVVCVGGGDM